MLELGVLLAIGGVTCLVLRGFFRAFEFTWPKHYFGHDNELELFVSRSFSRYALFRIGPVALALLVAGTVASRLDADRNIAVSISAVAYSLVSLGPDSKRALSSTPRKRRLLMVNAFIALGIGLSAVMIVAVGGRVDGFVPSLREAVLAGWIAFFVFILSRVLLAMMSKPPLYSLIQRATDEIDSSLLSLLDDADSEGVFRAVAIAEHLNRPAWVRTLERVVRRRGGTYGLMQVRSDSPLSDRESVVRFVEKYKRFVPSQHDDEWWDKKHIRRFVRRLNRDPAFTKMVLQIYWDAGELDSGPL